MSRIRAQTLDEMRFRQGEGDSQRAQKLEIMRTELVAPTFLNLSIVDLPTTDITEPLFRLRIRDDSWTFSGGFADASIAATGTPALRMRKNGVQIGAVAYAGTVGTVSFTDLSLVLGDLFEIYPPSPADATLDQLSVSLAVRIG